MPPGQSSDGEQRRADQERPARADHGISASAAAKLPTSPPAVDERVERGRYVARAPTTERIRSRIAHGDSAPSTSTGGATSTSSTSSEPENSPSESSVHAQQRDREQRDQRDQRRAEQRRQRQAARVRVPVGEPPAEPVAAGQRDQHDAIVFAHTTVEAPNAGATSRAAAISAPSVADAGDEDDALGKPHGSARRRRAHPRSPPRRSSTIEASISHSTGARSSVKTLAAAAAAARAARRSCAASAAQLAPARGASRTRVGRRAATSDAITSEFVGSDRVARDVREHRAQRGAQRLLELVRVAAGGRR